MATQRIAVVGGTASGPAAAAEARRVDPEARVTLFEQGNAISYGACEMPYYVAGQIDSLEELITFSPDRFSEEKGVEVRVRTRVHALGRQRLALETESLETGRRETIGFDKVILATGARPVIPEVDGVDAPNVQAFRTLDDAAALRVRLESNRPKHVVIAGAGFVGVELAEALTAQGIRTTLLTGARGVLASSLDAPMQALVRSAVERRRVAVREDRLAGFRTGAAGVTAVETTAGEQIGCDLVLLAMGVEPNVCLARDAGLRIGPTGALAVADTMKTSAPGVFACGDAIEVRRVVDNALIHSPLAPTGYRTARVAARNAARRGRGSAEQFPGVAPAFGVRVFELEVASVGLTEGQAREAGIDVAVVDIVHRSRVRLVPGSQPIHVRLIGERGSGRLLGGQLVGEEGAVLRADVLVPLLHTGGTARGLRNMDLIYAPPFAPSLDPLIVAARALEKAASASTGR